MDKLVICYMIQNEEDCIEGSLLSSVKIADEVVIVDGGSVDSTLDIVDRIKQTFPKITILHNKYEFDNPIMDGLQRQFYLDYIKQHYPDWYCLVVDADEVVEANPEDVRCMINHLEKEQNDLIMGGVPMEHFVYTLNLVDNSLSEHIAPVRFFKIKPDLYYKQEEHSVLTRIEKEKSFVIKVNTIKLWHFGLARTLFRLRKKYLKNKQASKIHTQEFLDKYYYYLCMSRYPIRECNYVPEFIKDYFQLPKLEEPKVEEVKDGE